MIRAKINKEKTWYCMVGLTSIVWIPIYAAYSFLAAFGNAATEKLGIEFKGLGDTEEEGDEE